MLNYSITFRQLKSDRDGLCTDLSYTKEYGFMSLSPGSNQSKTNIITAHLGYYSLLACVPSPLCIHCSSSVFNRVRYILERNSMKYLQSFPQNFLTRQNIH